MHTVCPITNRNIDEHVARVNGVFTVILVLLFIVLQWWGGLVFLAIDFTIRGFVDSKYSVMCWISRRMLKLAKISPRLINAGPKIFAAQVGLVLSLVSLVAFFSGCGILCLALAGILGFFSFLESAFGYCVACKLYPLFRRVS